VEVSVNSLDSQEEVSITPPSDRDCFDFVIYMSAMKRAGIFLFIWVFSLGAFGFTPDQYATQVLQKDLPRTLRWFAKIVDSQQLSQVEVYGLYQSTMPEAQENKQSGISVKGSVERMILLLDGARYFEQIQKAPIEYQNKKEIVMRALQATKDQMDRFAYGEDPQVLLDEWRALAITDIGKFTADLVETFMETQRILNTPVMAAVEQKVDAQSVQPPTEENTSGVEMVVTHQEATEPAVAEPVTPPAPVVVQTDSSFEQERFNSYVQLAEAGKVANECQDARVWKTDQAESCQSDDTLECDRSYARQCKKLQ